MESGLTSNPHGEFLELYTVPRGLRPDGMVTAQVRMGEDQYIRRLRVDGSVFIFSLGKNPRGVWGVDWILADDAEEPEEEEDLAEP